jgi:cellulose synthase/poly-beta-1,6-N-acetylglucosamine synthase-like glycosyltransferase
MLSIITQILFITFFSLHVIYFVVGMLTKPQLFTTQKYKRRYDFLIVARNEEKVIGDLIDSIHQQQYHSHCNHFWHGNAFCSVAVHQGSGSEDKAHVAHVCVGAGSHPAGPTRRLILLSALLGHHTAPVPPEPV